jgi:hypothetical protein
MLSLRVFEFGHLIERESLREHHIPGALQHLRKQLLLLANRIVGASYQQPQS